MKTKLLLLALFSSICAIQGQNRTIVNVTNSEISDNLDLRAVSSIFGDSRNLQDFEQRLNDPKVQISNLDLNNDNQVDYLRVIESVEGRTHLIIIQSVLDRDLYQDVATIEVEKDTRNQIHLQVVGNSYLYGQNYIYEPVYNITPFIYASFFRPYYRPYISAWTWNFYPSYYYVWNPLPVFRYRSNVRISLNTYNTYNYANYRRSYRAENLYNSRRSNAYERQNPSHSFSSRNSNFNNRYDLEQSRKARNLDYRNSNSFSSTRDGDGRYSNSQRHDSQRNDSQRNDSQRSTLERNNSQRNDSRKNDFQGNSRQNKQENSSVSSVNRNDSQRDNSQNRAENQNGRDYGRSYSQSSAGSQNNSSIERIDSRRDYSQNRGESQTVSSSQRVSPERRSSAQKNDLQRDFSQNRAETRSSSNSQRMEAQRTETPRQSESNDRSNSGSRSQNRRS